LSTLSAASRRVLAAVAALTLLGLVLRLARYQQSVLGDEMSTLYIVKDRSLGEVLDRVSGDAEISPPLYFILAWITTKLGSAPELIRLPSLIAGTISIPLVYLVGARLLNRATGLIAAAIMALSPFMIFYSADGRGYAVAIMLLLASTLAMLAAIREGRTRWWIAYGAFTALAMYTHYTAAFVLLAQLLWLLWAHPAARRPALIANVVAAVAYLPWVAGFLADMDSPTIDILNAIQGSGLEVKLKAVANWVIGQPYVELSQFPGAIVLIGLALGIVVAAIATAVRAHREGIGRWLRENRGFVLIVALALATPVLEALILLAGGTDLLGARNMNTSSAGLALLFGALIASSGWVVGTLCAGLVLAAFGVAAAKTLDDDGRLIGFDRTAAAIESQIGAGDVVVDMTAAVSPVPLTSLDAYLPAGHSEYRPFQPIGEPPFLPFEAQPPPASQLLRRAFAEAEGNRLFLVVTDDRVVRVNGELVAVATDGLPVGSPDREVTPLPLGTRVVADSTIEGTRDLSLFVIDVSGEIGPVRPRPAEGLTAAE
jgi:hypothetical protein